MEIEITDKSSIKEIQDKFNAAFPNLWIDFYYDNNIMPNLVRPEKIKGETRIKSLCKLDGSRSVDIDGEQTIVQLGKRFRDTLGLKIEVLRKSGNVWVGTGYTGDWTLESQNFEGKQIVID